MKLTIVFAFLILLASCGSNQTETATTAQDSITNAATLASPAIQKSQSMASLVQMDSLSENEKTSLLQNANIEQATWYDTYCPHCQSRCCRPCTANGDPSRCAETRFSACSKCGHTSRDHYAVRN